MRRLVQAVLAAIAFVALAGWLAAVAFVLAYEPAPPGDAAAIVVLSAGLNADGTMSGQTAARAARGVALYKDGLAPLLVMSGGRGDGDDHAKAALMAAAARDAGVPEAALVAEDGSHSTLQNALFVEDALGYLADEPLILVTSRYHLPRAWASFRWAGMDDLTLVPAQETLRPREWTGVGMEAVKWPVNVARAALVGLARAAGAPEARLEPLLR